MKKIKKLRHKNSRIDYTEKELEDYRFNEECNMCKICIVNECPFNMDSLCVRYFMLKRGIKIEPQRKGETKK